MAFKILSVSILEENIDILRFEQGMTNTFSAIGESQRYVDQKTLDKAAKWADQIHINSVLPSAEYTWSNFPKVNNRILKQLVNRHAIQYLETRQGVRVAFQDQGNTIVDALVKRRVSSLAAHEEEIVKLEKGIFAKYRHKIHRVTSLPVALCNAVVFSEQPKTDFMVVWVGERSTIFAISSPQGDIKVARNIPVAIDLKYVEDGDLEDMARELDRDIMTTLLLYSDTFEDPVVTNFYLLGNPKLSRMFETASLESVGHHGTLSLDNLPVRGLKSTDTRAYHLLSNLFPGRGYNLVDPAITWGQRFDRGYRYASMLLLGCLITTATWLLLTAPPGKASVDAVYTQKKLELEEVNNKLYQLQSKEIELKRFSGWESFYKNTYTNQPAWSKMFSSLAADVPKEFVFKSVEINPGKKTGVHGWTMVLTGQIKTNEWNGGLALLRDFGTKFHQSPYVDIIDVQYTPLEEARSADLQETSFDVVISMKLIPLENK